MNDPRETRRRVMLAAFCLGLALAGCGEEASSDEAPVEAVRPLKPLVYTELPDLTPRAAAVRERRLMRELLHGAEEGDTWGRLRRRENLPAPRDAEALGRLLYEALMQRDEARWDHAFVSPSSYAGMVHVDLERARKFVDELQGKSMSTWELFDIEHASEAPEGGLTSVFTFEGLELGQGRTVTGKLSRGDDPIEQHWGSVLKLGLRGTDVIFEVRVPKILRVADARKLPTGEPLLALAAPVDASRQLEMFIAAGIHLKAELLRSQEYPYPLSVGNFWRYRRYIKGTKPVEPSSMALLEPEERAPFDADEVLLEIVSIERYGSVRLVKYRLSYNDQDVTTLERHWLTTSRGIYACHRACVRHIDDLSWLLEHLQHDTPLYQFPLRSGQAWGQAGSPRPYDKGTVRVHLEVEDVTVPAGLYIGAQVMEARGGAVMPDPFLRSERSERIFARGKGVLRREVTGINPRGEEVTVIEELVESRIMP